MLHTCVHVDKISLRLAFAESVFRAVLTLFMAYSKTGSSLNDLVWSHWSGLNLFKFYNMSYVFNVQLINSVNVHLINSIKKFMITHCHS